MPSFWFKKRVASYGFTQGIDFELQLINCSLETTTYTGDKKDYNKKARY